MNTLPFTYKEIVGFFLLKGRAKVLDLGCGKGVAGQIFNKKRQHEFVGVDLYKPYVKICKSSPYYEKCFLADITQFKFKQNEYDAVLLLQVIEHLPRKKALNLLKYVVNRANRVIVTIPNGECEQGEYEKNKYQAHKSVWSPADFRKLGFKVYGQGLKFVYGGKSYAVGKANIWQKASFVASFFLMPLIFLVPSLGAQLICVKYAESRKKI